MKHQQPLKTKSNEENIRVKRREGIHIDIVKSNSPAFSKRSAMLMEHREETHAVAELQHWVEA